MRVCSISLYNVTNTHEKSPMEQQRDCWKPAGRKVALPPTGLKLPDLQSPRTRSPVVYPAVEWFGSQRSDQTPRLRTTSVVCSRRCRQKEFQ